MLLPGDGDQFRAEFVRRTAGAAEATDSSGMRAACTGDRMAILLT